MKPRVLVVDDDLDFAQLIEFNLNHAGCESIVAHTGVEALRLARAHLPDVILLDVMLPDLDGLAVCEILNSQPSTCDIPILMLSALDRSWPETRKSKARFVRFFTKPVNLKLLGECVRATAAEHDAPARSRLAERGA